MKNYSPKNKFLWDSWFIQSKKEHHVFYLQAKKTKDPEKRHNNKVSIGHAVSKNLRNWKELPVALEPGKKGEWDDLSLWTGSVIKKENKYFMFYTGRNSKNNNKWIQRIGLATSNDLIHWKKSGKNPVLNSSGIYLQSNTKNKLGKIGAWRDPFVFEEKGTYYILITARDKRKGKEYNGCIALAESKNLFDWKIHPPLLSPGLFDEMEVPQIIKHKGTYYLFFSAFRETIHPKYRKKHGNGGGLFCYSSKNLFEKYSPVNKNGQVIRDDNKIYGLRLIPKRNDEYFAVGWLNKDDKGKFVGKLSAPILLKIKNKEIKKNKK